MNHILKDGSVFCALNLTISCIFHADLTFILVLLMTTGMFILDNEDLLWSTFTDLPWPCSLFLFSQCSFFVQHSSSFVVSADQSFYID